jgi:VanZ family protein
LTAQLGTYYPLLLLITAAAAQRFQFGSKFVWRFFGWALLLLITVLSLLPHFRGSTVVSPLPHFWGSTHGLGRYLEHAAIFGATGFAFGVGYSNRAALVAALISFVGVIELAQLFVSDRHARLSDFGVNVAAILIGLMLGSRVSKKMKWST